MNTEASKDSEDKLLLSHEYDGIREFDNPMPKWWKWMFWGSFYFSIAYFFHYHLSENGDTVMEQYDREVAHYREIEAQRLLAGGGPSEDKLAELAANDGLMTDAKQLFVQRCAPCHGSLGEGKIGPNLTDDHWLHGDASLMAIHKAIHDGFPDKGMPPWSRQLRPVEVMKLAAFVGTLRNTHLPGPKGPEGTKQGSMQQEETPPPATATASASTAEVPQEIPGRTLIGEGEPSELH